MNATLSLFCDDTLSDERIQRLTNDLVNTLNKKAEITAKLPENNSEKGLKGEPITIGTCLLTALSSGTIVALFEVLKTFCDRERSLRRISIKRPDGGEITFESKDITTKEQETILELAQQFFSIK